MEYGAANVHEDRRYQVPRAPLRQEQAMSALLEAVRLTKVYRRGSRDVLALDGVSFSVERGEHITIMGASGSGKSTLLNILGLLDRPSGGDVILDGSSTAEYTDAQLSAFRRRHLGFVFQFFNLMPALSALENVALPMLLDGRSLAVVRGECVEVLRAVGLGERLEHYPHELSGGEMQRVAIARALVGRPTLILADEPTGNLDSRNAAAIHELMSREARARGLTLIVVSHDSAAANWSERVITLRDGRIETDERRAGPATP
jgi:putative ABC transport system ATP-binding protein